MISRTMLKLNLILSRNVFKILMLFISAPEFHSITNNAHPPSS
jgi:hypothetical protein